MNCAALINALLVVGCVLGAAALLIVLFVRDPGDYPPGVVPPGGWPPIPRPLPPGPLPPAKGD